MSRESVNSILSRKRFTGLVRITTVLALCVTSLGAYVRLSDAGLGCPDWPGCYGKLVGVPETAAEIEHATLRYPNSPVYPDKARKEVLHRYLAGVLSLFVFLIAALAVIRRNRPSQPLTLPLILAALVTIQIFIGMWTVTMLLKPLVVSAHLLCGLLILALLWYLAMPRCWNGNVSVKFTGRKRWRRMLLIGIGILVMQIASGAWTSSNYAALACTDFPTCQQQWLPPMNFADAFRIDTPPDGTSYEYGILDNTARTAIHVTHRGGALLVLLALGGFLLALLSNRPPPLLALAAKAALALLLLQVLLGILNVVLSLPLSVATAHTTVAAVLLLSLITIARMLESQAK